MSAVGIVSIALGLLIVCSRGLLVVSPAATMHWFESVISSDGRTRVLGMVALTLGATMIWAGATADSVLATVLSVAGWAVVVMSALALVLFPRAYRAIALPLLPAGSDESLMGWRMLGLLGVLAGALLIYYGVLAL